MAGVIHYFNFLRGKWVVLLNLALLTQVAGFHTLSRREETPLVKPLNSLPDTIGGWDKAQDVVMDAEAMKILQPDDYAIRLYERSSSRAQASLFVAYFRSQRTGHAPHSPQNCLPGNGWVSNLKEEISIPFETGQSIRVNRIHVAKGDEKSVVFYWYQTPTRVVASEYMARARLVVDSIQTNRSDTALVRVVVPIRGALTEGEAESAGLDFARSVHQVMSHHIPMLNSR